MQLLRLAARDVRNLAPFELDTAARVVVFHGANAQGKTNALEAIWALATLRPLRGHRPKDLIRWGESEASVSGDVDDAGLVRRYQLDLGPKRRTRIDGSAVRDVAEYFAGIRAIAFTPQHGRIVTDEPEWRRRWLDRAVFTLQPAHLERVRAYRRCLSQKSAALRDQVSRDVIAVLDHQLAALGARLVAARCEVLDALAAPVAARYGEISGTDTALGMRYRTAAEGSSIEERTAALLAAIERRREEEVRRRMCVVGPQKDEVVFSLDGKPARRFGSRGQVRSVVLSLKLAEMAVARHRGQEPLFLLDDLSSELDAGRTRRLVQTLLELGAQVFVTTTDPAPVLAAVEDTARVVAVEGGALTPG